MEQPVPVKEVKILETAEDIQERREQVGASMAKLFGVILFLFYILGPQQISGVQSCCEAEEREIGGQQEVPVLQTRCGRVGELDQ